MYAYCQSSVSNYAALRWNGPSKCFEAQDQWGSWSKIEIDLLIPSDTCVKQKKTNQRLLPYNDGTTCACLIIDWKWWLGVEDEIHAWMEAHLAKGRLAQKGMTVEFSSPEELTLFILKWC